MIIKLMPTLGKIRSKILCYKSPLKICSTTNWKKTPKLYTDNCNGVIVYGTLLSYLIIMRFRFWWVINCVHRIDKLWNSGFLIYSLRYLNVFFYSNYIEKQKKKSYKINFWRLYLLIKITFLDYYKVIYIYIYFLLYVNIFSGRNAEWSNRKMS